MLNALTYGPRPDDLARVRALGLEAFVEAQLHPERLDDAATDQALRGPTGYADRAEEWVNTGALLARMNFALGLAQHRFAGVRVDVGALVANADRRQPDAVLDRLLAALLHGPVSAETRAVLAAQVTNPRVTNPQVTRSMADDRAPAEIDVEKLVALVIGSPEFQRR